MLVSCCHLYLPELTKLESTVGAGDIVDSFAKLDRTGSNIDAVIVYSIPLPFSLQWPYSAGVQVCCGGYTFGKQ